MAVLINKSSRVIVQGITGRQGRMHAAYMREYGVNLVAGVTPGKGGQDADGVPVCDTVAEAIAKYGPVDATMVLVPALGVRESAAEAIENKIPVVVIITEHVPVQDTIYLRELAKQHGSRIVGPNTIGCISPGKCKVGVMPGFLYKEGPVGIVSRSGTLTHETASCLSIFGVGQSSCVGIGGDPVPGSSFAEILELFRHDPETKVVVLIGEIGGMAEENAAAYLTSSQYPKPVVAYIAGASAPAEKQMGHAGAIIAGHAGTVESKPAALEKAGAHIAYTLEDIYSTTKQLLEH